MKQNAKLFSFSPLIIAACSLLASCQENVFGVKEEVWNTMSEKERAQVIENHNQQKKTRTC